MKLKNRESLETGLQRRLTQFMTQYHTSYPSSMNKSFNEDVFLSYVYARDPSLKRKPEKLLIRLIDKILDTQPFESADSSLRKSPTKGYKSKKSDKQEENCELNSDFSDSSLEMPPDVHLIQVKDTNFLNRSLVKVYQPNEVTMVSPPAFVEVHQAITENKLNINTNTQLSYSALEEQSGNKENIVTRNIDRDENSSQIGNEPKRKRLSKQETIENKKSKRSSASSSSLVVTQARLSDLGGIDGCIEEILQLIGMPLRHPEIYVHLGIQPPRGILLHGPPGCGKTMLAHAIAGECRVPFLNIAAPSIVSGMSGESEKKLREVFEEAKTLAPCIVFIDEIDAITPKRETAQREMERRIVAQFLTCMDDISMEKTNNRPVILIGATNRPDSLDPALRRAGRFDREISLGVPDEEARRKIIEKLCLKLKVAGEFDFESLAKQTPGYVGADLSALTSEAGMIAVKRIIKSLIQNILDHISSDNEKIEAKEIQEDETVVRVLQNMDIDAMEQTVEQTVTEILQKKEDLTQLQRISRFLSHRTEPLSEQELANICITNDDFLLALKKVQPSSKREGFATVPDVTWDDIGALKKVREELRMAVVEPVKHPEYFKRVGIVSPVGVLLYGPPGCGKTLLAKAVANESHCNFISVKGPELLNKYVGESERSIRQVFTRAAASSPCIIFFDELDAICPSRSNDSESQHSSRLVNTLLTEMDGMQGRNQVYVIAATNRPDMIDPAMLRPGRLDKALYVDLPNVEERFEILRTVSRKLPLHPSVNLIKLASDPRCDGLSGADLASLVREAGVVALKSSLHVSEEGIHDDRIVDPNEIFITWQNFDKALNQVNPSVSMKDRKRYELLKVKFSGSYSSTS